MRKFAVQQASRFLPRGDQHHQLKDLDWDIMLVLDACRFDVFNEVVEWPVKRVRSPASKTAEWIAVAEESGLFEGTTIVAGNANYTSDQWDLGELKIIDVFANNWDEKLGIVPPEPVLDATDEQIKAGNSPVVGHILPPHGPYIGRVADEWFPAFPDTQIWKRGPGTLEELISPQVAMATGVIDADEAWQAYRASVSGTWEVCQPYIARWVRDGNKVLVTADHGEAFGGIREFGLYAHPHQCHIPALTHVPLARFSAGSVPDKVPETPEEQLEALGYV
jgi:hypothetical protein